MAYGALYEKFERLVDYVVATLGFVATLCRQKYSYGNRVC